MEKKLKILLDVEIVDDKANFELQGRSVKIAYSYQACGGGGGCGGGRCRRPFALMLDKQK